MSTNLSNRALMRLAAELNTYFHDHRGKCYLCPDKVGRKLNSHLIANDTLTLSFVAVNEGDEGADYRWSTESANEQFAAFRTVSLLQAQHKTEIQPGNRPPAAPAPPAVPDQVPLTPTVQTRAQQQVSQLDPQGHLDTITMGLMDAFKKVGMSATSIPQADAQCDIAGKVIDAFKVKAQIIATLAQKI